jgi:hypothetical protein
MCSDLRLGDVIEAGAHGRYLLKPSTRRSLSYQWAEVVTLRTGIMVHGDCETVVFKNHVTEHARSMVYWLAGYGYDYAEEKACIGGHRELEWDFVVARAYVCEWRREKIVERDVARSLWKAAGDGQYYWTEALQEADLFDHLGAGEVTPWRVFGAQAVLRRLVWLLERRDFLLQSRDWFAMRTLE